MKKLYHIKNIFVIIVLSLITTTTISQEVTKPLTAESLSKELNNLDFLVITGKIKNNVRLTREERQWYKIYSDYLRKYYYLLPETELDKISTDNLLFLKGMQVKSDTQQVNINEQENNFAYNSALAKKSEAQNIFLKQIFYSGYYGLYYGLAANAIFNFEDAMTIGTPMLVSGANMLVFLAYQNKEYMLTNEALWLRAHGKFVGAFGGFALSALLFGDDFLNNGYTWDYYGYNYSKTKPDYQAASLTIAMASSIGLGYLGVYLGNTKNWDESRISLYRHFSFLNTGIGNAIVAAFNAEDARWFGGVTLLSSASGYVLADKIADIKQYSRGDLIAAGGYTILNAGFGAGLITEFDNPQHPERLVIFPAIGALTGTYLSYKMLDDIHLTIQQGRRLNYAIIGSSLIGLGVALMLDFDELTTYYTLPYLTSMLSYSLLLKYYKKHRELSFKPVKNKNITAKININPQNLLVGKFTKVKFNRFNNQLGMVPPVINLKINFN